MRYILYCDGACDPNPGQMAVGYLIRERTGDKENPQDKDIHKFAEKLGEGTAPRAEYFAVIKAMAYVQWKYENEGSIPGLEAIIVVTDSQLVVNQVNGSYKVKDPHLYGLWSQIVGFKNFFKKAGIAVPPFYWQPEENIPEAHDLSQKALHGDKYEEQQKKKTMYNLIGRGIRMVPLSAFRRPEWAKLTVLETLVMELTGQGLNIKEIAKELGRAEDAIKDQLLKAKKKLKVAEQKEPACGDSTVEKGGRGNGYSLYYVKCACGCGCGHSCDLKYGPYTKVYTEKGRAALQGEVGEQIKAMREANAKLRREHLAEIHRHQTHGET